MGHFEFKTGCDESIVKGYLNSDSDQKNFEIRGIHCMNRAQRHLSNDDICDAQLFKMKKGDQEV